MIIDFDEILHDLELKRARRSSRAARRSRCPTLDGELAAVRVVDEDGGEAPLDRRAAGRDGRRRAGACSPPPTATRGRRPPAARRDRPRDAPPTCCAPRSTAPPTVTVHDLSTLVEAALIDRRRRSMSRRRSCCAARSPDDASAAARRAAADPPLGPGRRAGTRRKIERRDPQGVPLAGAATPSRPSRSPTRVGERAHALGTRLRPDRDGAGHRPGGARPRRPHARRRALHRLPRRARDAARALAGRAGRAGRPIPVRRGRRRARRAGPAPTCASGSRSRRSGLDLPLDAAALERELRRSIRRRDRARRPRAAGRAQRQGADRARRRLLALRRPHPAHLHLRGDARLGHRARRHRRAARLRTSAAFRRALEHGVEIGRDRPARCSSYDLDRLAAALDPTADLDFDFLGLQTLYDRYLLVDKTGARPRRLETPQLFWLRVAMGVCLGETERPRGARARPLRPLQEPPLLLVDADALQRRHAALAALELLPLQRRRLASSRSCSAASPRTRCARSGPAASAARGPRCAAPARTSSGTNGETQGVIPFLKLHNDQLVAVNQGGKRAGLRLRLPRGLAQRHPRVPRAAPQHRRRAPPHARHEHGVLDSRPVHEARRGARALDALPLPTTSPTCTSSTAARSSERYVAYEQRVAGGRDLRRDGSRRSSSGSRCSRCSSRPATRGSPSRTRATSAARRTTRASSTRRNLCTEITLNTERRRDRRLQPRLDRPRPAPDRRRRARPREAARDHPRSPCARSTT